MSGGKEEMEENHSRASVLHYRFDFFTDVRSVTVLCALRAFGFVFLKRTIRQTFFRIIEKPAALGTKRFCPAVVITAIKTHYDPKDFKFSFHPPIIARQNISASSLDPLPHPLDPPPGRMVSVTWICPASAGYTPEAHTRQQ